MLNISRIIVLFFICFTLLVEQSFARNNTQKALDALDEAIQSTETSGQGPGQPKDHPTSADDVERSKENTTATGQDGNQDGAQGGDLELNTDRYGNDYSCMHPVVDVEQCKSLCDKDDDCVAFTWIKSGYISMKPFNNDPICCLKNAAGQPTKNPCCISGVK